MAQTICSIDDCDLRAKSRGWCAKHYERWRRYGHPLPMSTFERAMAKVSKDSDGCWRWTGSKQGAGYGKFWLDGGPRLAHRVVYELHVGSIADGLTLDHLCRVPACVNPDHLEPVSLTENVLRGIGPTATNARKTHCLRGHEFTEQNTDTKHGRRECLACRKIRNGSKLGR